MAEQVEALVKPEILIWARDAAGMSVADAARKIQVGAKALAEWEEGKARPTINQLSKLADAYKRPLGVFFLPEPPAEETILPDFRRFDTGSTPDLSSEL